MPLVSCPILATAHFRAYPFGCVLHSTFSGLVLRETKGKQRPHKEKLAQGHQALASFVANLEVPFVLASLSDVYYGLELSQFRFQPFGKSIQFLAHDERYPGTQFPFQSRRPICTSGIPRTASLPRPGDSATGSSNGASTLRGPRCCLAGSSGAEGHGKGNPEQLIGDVSPKSPSSALSPLFWGRVPHLK